MHRALFRLRRVLDFLRRRPVFELDYYRECELSRLLNLFAHVDLEAWKGRRLLEVGAGHGHLGDAFAKLGFDVTSSDGREEHVAKIRERGRRAFVLDLDACSAADFEGYDIVLAFGVLYHLREPERFLRSCAACPILLLESAVSDSSEPVLSFVPEKADGWRGQDQALNAVGCRPSVSWVEQTCRSVGFDVVRDISNPIGDWEIGTYDWEPLGSGENRRKGRNLRRMWIAERSQPR